jgi:hypothetical protein
MRRPNIIEFITDPALLGLTLSVAQETLLRGIYGLPLPTEEHRDLWHRCTGRTSYPAMPFQEVTVIAGARAGKDSRIAAPIFVYEALFGGHDAHVSRGGHGVIPLVAQDQRATKIAFGYIREYLTRSRLLAPKVLDVRSSAISLQNGLTIECFPSTVRSLRGWSIPAAAMDELAFFRLEGASESDVEIQVSIRRGMQSFPFPRLVKISTPYLKGGILYEDFKQPFGQDDPDLLVWRAPSLLMNPTLRKGSLDREQRRDSETFRPEYEAEFFITGHGDVQTGVKAMKGGAVDFLIKPVNDRELLGAIERGMNGARQALWGRAEATELQGPPKS